jgi:xanthine dehydrogenase YagS FAD-binding subunit
MLPFTFERAVSPALASRALAAGATGSAVQGRAPAELLAGGTTLLDLMKLEVMAPAHVVDAAALRQTHSAIEATPEGLRLGAFATMAEAAAHPGIVKTYPVLSQSLLLAASAQLRNMATLGGNVLQRTRCTYFRDVSWAACNKRNPGSGCAALDGTNRLHAVLGTSDQCIASYPGDWAQGMLALDAGVEILGTRGPRRMSFADLHRQPGTTPNIETSLEPGDVITAFTVPSGPWTRRSLYLKVRDRQSYEFALASAAIALDLDGGGAPGASVVREARIALGGVATAPWRAREAEALLIGKVLDETSATLAARAAYAGARPRQHNAYKVALGQATLVRALLQAAAMEIRA